jgi:hypothetical protein
MVAVTWVYLFSEFILVTTVASVTVEKPKQEMGIIIFCIYFLMVTHRALDSSKLSLTLFRFHLNFIRIKKNNIDMVLHNA